MHFSVEQPIADLKHDHLINALVSGEPIPIQRPHGLPSTARTNAKWIWALTSLPRVDIVLSYANADGVMIEAAARAGARGVVSAATGAGRPTPAQDAAFDKAFNESGMLMCLCSRVASGRVVRSPGLKRKGFVASDNLPPWKARILLSLALSKTTDADDIQRMFDVY